jgi:23S rRNA (uridine2552-2'-O)-methyltransferase
MMNKNKPKISKNKARAAKAQKAKKPSSAVKAYKPASATKVSGRIKVSHTAAIAPALPKMESANTAAEIFSPVKTAAARSTPGGHSSGAKKTEGKAKDPRFAQNVKTSYKRSLSSIIWLQRQLNDPYVAKAKEQGWRSRAAFKLIEIDEKYRLLKHGQTIVDLGAAPGGWAQYAAKRVGSDKADAGVVVAIDLLPIDPLPGVMLAEMDFTDDDAPERLLTMLAAADAKRGVDGVLSDLAGNTTGHRMTDHLRIMGLAEMAAAFAAEVLNKDGYFIAKLFQGGETANLITMLKHQYTTVRHVKPLSSRADSSELYVLATGFRGQKAR